MLVRAALLALVMAAPATAQIVSADYTAPTTRYAHGVLGDNVEWGALDLTLADGQIVRITLPTDRVFEDLTPRLHDITGDGRPEAVVIESHADQGARLAIYTETGLLAATPYIGQRFRWLAPFAVGDLDSDGQIELAYIDRPHLAKTLRIWRYTNGQLTQVAQLSGLTNHKIGQDFISGGVRDCGSGPEMILANADWTDLMSVRLTKDTLSATRIAPFKGASSWNAALTC